MKKISLRQNLLDLVSRRPGLTASEYTRLIGRTGPKDTSRVASALYKLAVVQKIIYRRQEPDCRALPTLQANPVTYAIYKLTGEFKGHTAHRYYPNSSPPQDLLKVESIDPNLL